MRKQNRFAVSWILVLVTAIGIVWATGRTISRQKVATVVDPNDTGEIQTGEIQEDHLEDVEPGVVEGTAVGTEPPAGVTDMAVDAIIAEDDHMTADPEEYLGKTIRLRGSVNETIDCCAMTVDADGIVGEHEILVVNARNTPLPVFEGEMVEVTGPVVRFVIADLETELGYDLEDELFESYSDWPMIVAHSIVKQE